MNGHEGLVTSFSSAALAPGVSPACPWLDNRWLGCREQRDCRICNVDESTVKIWNRGLLAAATPGDRLERRQAPINVFPQVGVGLVELPPKRREIRGERLDIRNSVLVQDPHLVT